MKSLKYFLIVLLFGIIMPANILKTQPIPINDKQGPMNENQILLPVQDDPTISIRLWFKFGSTFDPMNQPGLAELTALMLSEGSTENNNYSQILNKLYPIASSYNSKTDKEMTIFYGRTYKDNIVEFYQLFSDAILHPAFNEEDFNRIKSSMINFLENQLRYSSDEELGKAALYGLIFRGTPYEHLSEGTISGLRMITINDVKNFYNQYYKFNNLEIAIGGGYEPSLPEMISNDFRKLGLGQPLPKVEIKPFTVEVNKFLIIDKDADATAISLGFPINLHRDNDDYYALTIFNSWFGEHRNSSSHLYQVLREKRGLNYGDYSYIEAFLNGGELNVPEPNNARRSQIFEIWIRPVKNENRLFAIKAALRELQMIVEKGLTEEQFELTKKFLYKYAMNYAPTTMARLGYAIDSKFYHTNTKGDFIDLFRQKMKEITLQQVNNAIKRYLKFNNICFSVVTKDAEKFKKELMENPIVNVKYATPPSNEVKNEDIEINKIKIKIEPRTVEIINVDRMFE